MQDKLEEDIAQVISDDKLVQHILTEYIPSVLVEKMGLKNIENLLGTAEPQPYRDTIFTKKLASKAYYKFGTEWESFIEMLEKDMHTVLYTVIQS